MYCRGVRNMLNVDELMEVTSDRVTDPSTGKFDPDGIFSEVIFGPVKDFKCSCGKYNIKSLYKGKRCPNCNVLCDSKNLRYVTFGKITLPIPIIKYLERSKFKGIMKGYESIIEPTQSDMARSIRMYLNYRYKGDLLYISNDKSADFTSRIPVSGILSLYLALTDVLVYTNSNRANFLLDKYTNYVIVTPPQTRTNYSETKSGEKKEIESDVNKYYRRLIRMRNYVKEQASLHIIDDIRDCIENDKPIDDYMIDVLGNQLDLLAASLQYFYNKIYGEILSTISHKSGKIRSSFLRKTIDFSSRAVVIPGPDLKAYEVRVPLKTFLRFYMIEFIRYLINEKAYNYNPQIRAILKDTELLFKEYVDYLDEFINFILRDDFEYLRDILINRQPTLWRYGITGVRIVGISRGDVIEVSPLIMEQMNADCDGDTMAMYRFHDKYAQKEILMKNHNLTNIRYDHNSEMLHRIRLEALYMFNILMSSEINDSLPKISVDTLDSLEVNYNIDLSAPVFIESSNQLVSYGVALANKLARFKSAVITKKVKNYELSEILYTNSVNKRDYHERLCYLNRALLWLVSVHDTEALTIPIEIDVIYGDENKKYLDYIEKLPNNPFFGYIIQNACIDKVINNISKNPKSKTFKLMGTKLSRTQLARCNLLVGYIANDKNQLVMNPIKSSYFKGIDEDSFFEMCYGSRKGIVDKSNFTPRSGYFERTAVMNLSFIELDKDNCMTRNYFEIEIMSDNHAKSLYNRYYLDTNTMTEKIFDKNTKYNIGDKFLFRSPITCENENFKICKRCFGNYDLPSNRVGIMAAQYIAERFTQLTLRTFHTSGSCSLSLDKDVVKFFEDHMIEICKDSDKINVVKFDIDITAGISQALQELPGFIKIDKNILKFRDLDRSEIYENNDIVNTVKQFTKELSSEGQKDIDYIYRTLMSKLLDISIVYSSFLEIFLCNMFLDSNGTVLRYSKTKEIAKRKSIKNLHTVLENTILDLLYEPNAKSILKIKDIESLTGSQGIAHSVYEELWYKY